MSRHRADGAEAAVIGAFKDFDDACRTAVELNKRGRWARAHWALVRAGRRVAKSQGITFDEHPLGDLVYLEPFKLTPADLARERRAAQRAAALPPISGAACAPGGLVRPLGGRTDHAAPESVSKALAGPVAS